MEYVSPSLLRSASSICACLLLSPQLSFVFSCNSRRTYDILCCLPNVLSSLLIIWQNIHIFYLFLYLIKKPSEPHEAYAIFTEMVHPRFVPIDTILLFQPFNYSIPYHVDRLVSVPTLGLYTPLLYHF